MHRSKQKTILLVEDEHITMLLQTDILKTNGFKVVPAGTGEEAIRITASNPSIDLILMDIDLGSGIDGTQAAEIILKDHDIPLVFLSSHTEPEIVKKTEGITSYGYVVKNSGEVVLLASINMAFNLFEANIALKQKNTLLDITGELTKAGGWEWDIETNHMSWTLEMYHIHGISNDKIITGSENHIDCSLQCYDEKDRNSVMQAFNNCVERAEAFDLELPFTSYDGRRLWVKTLGRPVIRKGKIVSIIGNLVDITDRKMIEDGIRNESARKKAQSEVIYKISRSPYLIKGNIEKLSREITELASKALNIERAGVWLLNDSHNRLINIDNYCAFAKEHTSGDVLLECEFKSEFDILENTNFIAADDAVNDPRTSCYADKYLKTNNITSMLDIAIKIEGKCVGTLCFEHTDKIHHWLDDEISFASQLADQIAIAISNSEIKRSEQNLRNSEEKYRLLFERSPLGLVHYSNEGIIIDCNDNFIKIIGSSRKALIGLDLFKLPDKRVVKAVKEALSGKTGKYEDFYSSVTANKVTPLNAVFTPVVNYRQEMIGGLGIIQDITKRKTAENALKEKTRLLKSITDNIFDLISLTDLKGNYKFVGNSHSILGYGNDFFLNKNVMDFVHPDDLLHVKKVFQEFIKSGTGNPRVEYRYRCSDGTYIWFETLGKHLKNENNEITEILFSTRDITENHNIKQKLIFERNRLFMLLEAFPGFIYLQAKDHTLKYVNKYFKEHFGEIEGRFCYEILTNRKNPCPKCPTFDVFRTNKPKIREWHSSPNNRIYQLYDHPFLDSDGTSLILGIGIDITELKNAEKRAHALTDEKDLLLKETHHRIKNNLNSIYAYLYLKAQGLPNKCCKNLVKDSGGCIQSIMMLYDNLYRSENYIDINARDYVKMLINLISRVLTCEVPVKIETDIHNFIISAKKVSKIGIILNELLTNSYKHAFSNNISGLINISLTKGKDSDMILLDYRDNGPGVPDDILSHRDNTFGLNLIEMLTKQINGVLSIDCKDGTCFQIRFSSY